MYSIFLCTCTGGHFLFPKGNPRPFCFPKLAEPWHEEMKGSGDRIFEFFDWLKANKEILSESEKFKKVKKKEQPCIQHGKLGRRLSPKKLCLMFPIVVVVVTKLF